MSVEAKPFASLSSGLLARKGHAKPAMRPQGFTSRDDVSDLGWNDMGEPSRPVALVPEVLAQRAELAAAVTEPPREETAPVAEPAPSAVAEPAMSEAEPAPVAAVAASAAPAADPSTRHGKAAFTLRLDPDRHLRLRLASAVAGRSSQQLVTAALDAFLEQQSQVEALARQLPPSATGGSR